MTESDARDLLAEILSEIAPEADLDQIDPVGELQPQLDIDSIDFLRFVDAIATRTGLPLPEEDYPEVATLAGAVSYLCTAR